MAIDSYAKLQSEIQDTLDRDDLVSDVTAFSPATIEGVVKRAIRKCELRVQRTLRTRDMETSTTITFSNGTTEYSLPADFLSARLFYLDQDPIKTLQQDSLENLIANYPNAAVAEPASFAISGDSMFVRPIPDGTYSAPLFYYQEIPALSDSNTSNWLLTAAPDVYLYGACIEITPYLKDDARIQVWKGAFDEAIRLITEDDAAAKWNGVLVTSGLPVQIVV